MRKVIIVFYKFLGNQQLSMSNIRTRRPRLIKNLQNHFNLNFCRLIRYDDYCRNWYFGEYWLVGSPQLYKLYKNWLFGYQIYASGLPQLEEKMHPRFCN